MAEEMYKVHCCGHYRTSDCSYWADFYHQLDPLTYNRIIYNKPAKLRLLQMYYPDAIEITDGFIIEKVN